MRPFTLPVLTLFALSPFRPLVAAEPLAGILPENTGVFLNVTDLKNLERFTGHPLAKTLTTGELGKVLKPFLEKMEGKADGKLAGILESETGLSLKEILAKFPGSAAGGFGLSFEKLMAGEGATNPDASVTLIADYTGDEELMSKLLKAVDRLSEEAEAKKKAQEEAEEKVEDGDAEAPDEPEEEEVEEKKPEANWPGDYEENVIEIGGAQVHEWTVRDPEKMAGDQLSWCVVDGKATLSLGKSDLKEVVQRLTKPSRDGSLATTAAWKTLPEQDLESDVLAGVNLERMLGEIQEGLRLKMEKGELNTGGLPINPLQAWTGAGLDQFRMAYLSTRLEPADAVMHMGLTYAEKPALLKIYAAKGPGTPPGFLPADVQEASWGTMDWGGFFDGMKELVIAVSPMAAGGLEMGLGEMKKKIGVDIRTDLLGQMGDDLWSVSHTELPSGDEKDTTKPEDGTDGAEALSLNALALSQNQSQVMGIALRDAKAFNLSLKSVFNTMAPGQGLFDDREFMGDTIHQVKGIPEPMQLAWLIKDDTLIVNIGKPELLEKVLAGMAKKPANPLVEEAHVKAAFGRMPDGQVSSGYVDAGGMVDLVLGMVKPLMEDQAEGDFAETLENLPDRLELPWIAVSRAYLGDGSAEVRLRLSAKP